ncbi:hypothetical protein ACT7DO_28485 [Bacillus pacificus]
MVAIVKETSTGVNLYDSDQDGTCYFNFGLLIGLQKNKPDEFKTKLDPRMYISLRFNQKMQLLKIKKSVKQIDPSI